MSNKLKKEYMDKHFPNGIGLVGEIPAKPKRVFMNKKERFEFLVGCLVLLLAIIGAISLVIKVISSL